MSQLEDLINLEAFREAAKGFKDAAPYPNMFCDGFFKEEVAQALAEEFPDYESDLWHEYNNPIEVKKVQNDWNRFPPMTYKVFQTLNSPEFVEFLEETLEMKPLFSDSGLNGGGWHIHRPGGKLNVHLDYSIHPKLQLERKLNILIYMNPNWKAEWGGQLGLWEQHETKKAPGPLVKEIAPIFNRAALFDTTCNSWHGLPEPVKSPEGQCRKSLAAYYLTIPSEQAEQRGKALFAPWKDQEGDQEVLDLIEKRAQVNAAEGVYRKKA
jgi:hypothetical protein